MSSARAINPVDVCGNCSERNGCGRLRHYDKPYRGGSSTNTYGAGTTDNLSAWMNNRTESVAYFSS